MFKPQKLALFGAILAFCPSLTANDLGRDGFEERVQDFVSQHLELALVERAQFNIPVSITLAQAILESGLGTSRLVREGNNYFGIKCHPEWQGDTIRARDDDYDKQGNLIESCFRAYATPAESFRDHSIFLQRTRYQNELANLSPTDYVGWARGLQAAGYATDQAYAQKLIDLIEANGLAQFDVDGGSSAASFVGPPPPPPAPARQRTLMIEMRPQFASFVLR